MNVRQVYFGFFFFLTEMPLFNDFAIYAIQWRSKVPKSGGAHRHVIFVPSVKNQYKRVVFGCMVI